MVTFVNENPITYRSKTMFIKALFELMAKKPYTKITIKELCQRANLARQTFYHNFNTMDDIIIEYILRREKGRMQYYSCMDYEKKTVYRKFFQSWKEDEIVLSLLIKNNLVYILNRTYYNLLTNTSSKVIRRTEKVETDYSYEKSLFVGGLVAVLHLWSETGMKEPPEKLAECMCSIPADKLQYDPAFSLN